MSHVNRVLQALREWMNSPSCYFSRSLSRVTVAASILKKPLTIFSSSSPATGSSSKFPFLASATNSGSFKVAWKACRKTCTRSLGVPGGNEYRYVMAPTSCSATWISLRPTSLLAKLIANGNIGQFRMRSRGILQNDFHFSRVQLLAPSNLDRCPREPAKARYLAGIDGQPNLRRSLVTGNDLHRQAERFLQDHCVVVGRGTGRRRAHFDRDGRALPLLGAVDAAGSRHNAGIVVLARRADVFELARIKLDPLPPCKLVQDQSADPVSQRQAVRLGLPVKIVSADEKTRPRQVFHDKCRIAGKMLPHVASQHTGIGVKSAPGCSRHDQANRLTLVKILCRYHASPTSRDQQYKRREHIRKKFLPHVVTSFFPNTAKIDIGDAGQHSTYFALTQASFSSTLCVIKSRCSTSEYRASR